MNSGVYRIRNLLDGKVYVGSAFDLARREKGHFDDLRKGKHRNGYLQRAWSKYGEASFVFEVIETCDRGAVIALEQRWIDALRAADRSRGYNIQPLAGTIRGRQWSAETRAKFIATVTGRKLSPETRRRMSEAAKRRAATPDGRARLLALSMAVAADPKTLKKMAETLRRRSRTEEGLAQLERMRSAALAPEARAKSAAKRSGRVGRSLTSEQIAKLVAARRRAIALGSFRLPRHDRSTGRFTMSD